MRTLIATCIAAVITVMLGNIIVGADPPSVMSYQGRLTDSGGNPLNGQFQLHFSLYTQASGGSSIWTETQTVDVTQGDFNVLLGSVSPLDNSYFETSPLYLGTAVAGDPELTPRDQIGAVGYSYRTGTVDGAEGGAVTGDLNLSGDLTVAGTTNLGNTIHTPSGVTIQSNLDTLKITAGSTAISIQPNGVITLEGSTVYVVAQSNLNLSATSNVNIYGDNISLTATHNVDVSAGANATVSAALQAKTQANTVNLTGNSTTDINGGTVQIN